MTVLSKETKIVENHMDYLLSTRTRIKTYPATMTAKAFGDYLLSTRTRIKTTMTAKAFGAS